MKPENSRLTLTLYTDISLQPEAEGRQVSEAVGRDEVLNAKHAGVSPSLSICPNERSNQQT